MNKENYFQFRLNEKTTIKGDIKIYQGKNGAIYMLLFKGVIVLTLNQIKELGFSFLYEMDDFDESEYKTYYFANE